MFCGTRPPWEKNWRRTSAMMALLGAPRMALATLSCSLISAAVDSVNLRESSSLAARHRFRSCIKAS